MGAIKKPGATLGVLTGINVLNYLDRYLGGALTPLIIAHWHLSDRQGGTLQGAFILVYSLISPLMGWLGDRRHRLRLASVGVLIWSAATVASGLAPTYAWLLVARALVGVGEASYTVVTPSLISDHYPPDRRGRALAVFYAALAVGPALGYLLAGRVGVSHGWQHAFFVGGAPGFVLALLLLVLEEPQRGRYDPPGAAAKPPSLRESLGALRHRTSFWFNTACQTIYTFSMGGLQIWMPIYFIRHRGVRYDHAQYMFGLLLLVAGFIGTLAGGQLGDRLARRYPAAHFSMGGWTLLSSVPFTVAAVLAPQPAIFWPAMFVTLVLLFLNTGPLNAAMANVLPPFLRARGVAINTLAIHILGDAISPALIGAASDRAGLFLPVLVTGVLLGLSGVTLLLGRRALVADLQAAAR
jgi:MFS family permease